MSEQTGTADFNNAADGGNKVITIFNGLDAIYQKYWATSRTNKKRRRDELGPWHDFLYDGKDNYFQPVLSASSFAKYMRSCKGSFRPVGECVAKAAWAHFLHGLGITPGRNVVERRSFPGLENADIMLEVDGEVIAHVVNLLESPDRYVTPLHREGASTNSPDEPSGNGLYQTRIGNIRFTRDAESLITSLTFQPVSVGSRVHRFFGLNNLDIDAVLARYDLALDKNLGVSDASLAWPPPATHISERLRKLLEIRNKVQYTWDMPQDQRPIFVTESWQKGAERIRRRAVGGANAEVFLSDASEIANNKGLVESEADKSKAALSRAVQRMLESLILKPYKLDYGDWGASGFDLLEVHEAIQETLQSYGKEPSGSWKHNMYLYREALYKLLSEGAEHGFDMRGGDVHILAIDSTTKLWWERALKMETAMA